MLTAQNEFQILNLHHKKTYISNIKLPDFLMPKVKVKKNPPKFLELAIKKVSYKNNVLLCISWPRNTVFR